VGTVKEAEMAAKKTLVKAKAGQIWTSTQPSTKGRKFVITKIRKGYAYCELLSHSPGKIPKRVHKYRKIRLDQFVPSKYVLASKQKKRHKTLKRTKQKPLKGKSDGWSARDDGSIVDPKGNLIALASSLDMAYQIVTLHSQVVALRNVVSDISDKSAGALAIGE
jgi:hypothetical protein